MNVEKTKERLEDLRKENKLTLQELSQKIRDKTGCFISHTALKEYENNDKLHKMYGRTAGMSIKNLSALADFYGVSTDYLLGKTNVKSQKIKIRQICETTGLSENTVLILIEWYNLQRINNLSDYRTEEAIGQLKVINEIFEKSINIFRNLYFYLHSKFIKKATIETCGREMSLPNEVVRNSFLIAIEEELIRLKDKINYNR